MEQFPKLLASRLARQQQATETHPDAGELTALAEDRLKPTERKPVLAHLAICAECREVLALISRDAPEPLSSKKPAFNAWSLSWAAGLAAVCLLVVTVVRHPSPALRSNVAPVPVSSPPPPTVTPETVAPKPSKKVRARLVPPPKVTPFTAPAPPPPPTVMLQSAKVEEPPKPALVTNKAAPVLPDIPKQELPTQPEPSPARSSVSSLGFAARRQYARPALLSPLRKQSLWTLDDANPGMLRKSDDGGRTWTPIAVNSQTNLLSLSVSGGDIWAGGDTGTLLHSTDNGLHWNPVTVQDGAVRLTDAITAIQTQGAQLIRVRTKSGDWLSSDGGTNWVSPNKRH
jgi:hypothetical protein